MIKDKIFKSNSEDALNSIIDLYNEQWYCIVNYLYFANFAKYKLYDDKLTSDYKDALMLWDFLLPDWIAMQTYFKRQIWEKLYNLNWTDFIKIFLNKVKSKDIDLYLYWAKGEILDKSVDYLNKNCWLVVKDYQNWYSEYDFTKIINNNRIKILLVWRWTPLQELWAYKNIEKIKQYWIMVFNQWWTFEFWAWNEIRAPKFLRVIKLEWLWRLLTNPKKNFKKVYYSMFLFKLLLKKN